MESVVRKYFIIRRSPEMGLKTTNYHIKKFDVELSQAYAKLRTLVLNSDGRVEASFSIQQSRKHCEEFDPIEVVKLYSKAKWDRNTPLEKFAYEAIKSETYTEFDPETGSEVTKTEKGLLSGWDNDIVE